MDDSLAAKLECAHSWFNDHCRELYHKLHDFDHDGALQQLAIVRRELAESELPHDIAGYLAVRLRYVQLQAEKIEASADESMALRAALLEELTAADENELATAARRVLRIQLYAQMQRDGEAEYPVEEFRKDYCDIPSELYTREFSLYAASCAYMHAEIDTLEKIFIDFTLNPGVFQTSFVWQALNLMYQMATGKATERDAEETIKVLQHIRHWRFIEKLVWQEVVKRGLVDAHVEELLAKKLAELEAEDDFTALTSRRVRRTRMT
jgi:hypothetical protein